MALAWWEEVLQLELCQCHSWVQQKRQWAHLYCDARGHPAHIAAVLFIDGQRYFCDMAVPTSVLDMFTSRKDNQILGLELLSIALGLCSFVQLLSNRRVIVWSDNTGAEAATKKGSAKEWDHSCIAHCLWTKAVQMRTQVHVERVPSKENIADLPSREEYQLMQTMGIQRVPAQLSDAFHEPQAWSSLSLVLNLPELDCYKAVVCQGSCCCERNN